MNRDKLYDRIEKRIDIMIEYGLVAEVNALLEKGYSMNSVAMQGLGYKEIAAYLCGKISFDEAVRILKRDTRRFAKRQITWFKHQCDGDVINVDEYDNIKNVAEYIANKIKA
ncbi:MAG: hypothetical protein IJ736_14630 [Firmicutes bacterium]|nr:hypothetical protein [Bacillota bacterium]